MSRENIASSGNARRALLCGGGTWALLIAAAAVVESFNAGGPEYAAPIPAVLIGAVLLGWIPATVVGIRVHRKN